MSSYNTIVFEPLASNTYKIFGIQIELMLGLCPSQQAGFDVKTTHIERNLLSKLIDEKGRSGRGPTSDMSPLEKVDALRNLVQVQRA